MEASMVSHSEVVALAALALLAVGIPWVLYALVWKPQAAREAADALKVSLATGALQVVECHVRLWRRDDSLVFRFVDGSRHEVRRGQSRVALMAIAPLAMPIKNMSFAKIVLGGERLRRKDSIQDIYPAHAAPSLAWRLEKSHCLSEAA